MLKRNFQDLRERNWSNGVSLDITFKDTKYVIPKFVIQDLLMYGVFENDTDLGEEINYLDNDKRFKTILEQTLDLDDNTLVEQLLLFTHEEIIDEGLLEKLLTLTTEWNKSRFSSEVKIYLAHECETLIFEIIKIAETR